MSVDVQSATKYPRHSGKFRGRSTGKAPGSQLWYRKVYSGSKWNAFVQKYCTGSLLQVCCGGSQLGEIRIDIDPKAPAANVLATQYQLPLRDQSFDTVACDPIYRLAMLRRIELQRELARIARRRILFKAPWIPRCHGFILRDTYLIGSHTCAYVSVLSVLERREKSGNLFKENFFSRLSS